MEHIAAILQSINEIDPMVLVVILFGIIILLMIGAMYAFLRWGLPAISKVVKEWSESFEAVSASWREIVAEQKLNNERQRKHYEIIASEHEERIEKLETESQVKDALIATLQDELKERDRRIDALEKELKSLKSSSSEKIEQLQEELKQVRAERDELRQRIKDLEDKDKEGNAKKT